MSKRIESWSQGDSYEYFMGRWSRLMASVFLHWLDKPAGLSWLDLGCGTGALTTAIHHSQRPSALTSVDPSASYLDTLAKESGGISSCLVGDASRIPVSDHSHDVLVSGLALNFFPDQERAFSEMRRVVKPGGTIAAYVWDYRRSMEFLRYFWDAAISLNPKAIELDEGRRFPLCDAENLVYTFEQAGLSGVSFTILEIGTTFRNFEDYWNPFLGGQGPAPGYLASLDESSVNLLSSVLQERLPVAGDGSIHLKAGAIAICGLT